MQRILIYLLILVGIFLILRYFPYINLNTVQVLIVTLIIMIVIGMGDFMFNYKSENFGCNTCKENFVPNTLQTTQNATGSAVPTITPPTVAISAHPSSLSRVTDDILPVSAQPTTQPTCRVVCDGSPNVSQSNLQPVGQTVTTGGLVPSNPTPIVAQTTTIVPTGTITPLTTVTPLPKEQVLVMADGFRPEGFGGMYYDDYKPYSIDNGTLWATNDDKRREREEKYFTAKYDQALENRASNTIFQDPAWQEPGAKSQTRQDVNHNRRIEGDIDNDLPYSDYNHLPIAVGYKSHDYEYGYSFLPPEKWYPSPPRPPICVTDQRAQVMPMYANGTPMDVKEFHSSRRLTPPDRINTLFVEEKLNAGR